MYRTRRDDQLSIGRPVFWVCVLFVLAMLVSGAGLGLLGAEHLDTTVRREARAHSLAWLRRHALLEAQFSARTVGDRLADAESAAVAIADVVARQGPGPLPAPDRAAATAVLEARDAILPELRVPGVAATGRASTLGAPALASLTRRGDELGDVLHALSRNCKAIARVAVWTRGEGVIFADGFVTAVDDPISAPTLAPTLPLDSSDGSAGPGLGWNFGASGAPGVPSVTFDAPVEDEGGARFARVQVTLDFGVVRALIDANGSVRPRAATLLVDRDRTPLHVPDAAVRALGHQAGDGERAAVAEKLLDQLTGSEGFLIPGEPGTVSVGDTFVCAAVGIPGTNWCAISVLPRETEIDAAFDASAGSRDVSHRIGLGLLIFTLLFGAIAIFAGLRFSAWLRSRLTPLLESARAMARGDFTKHIPTRGHDEISAVAIALNTSRVRLRSTLARLEESQRRIAVLIQSMTEGFVITDGDDRISFANDRFASMLKRSTNEIVGTQVSDLVTHESLETYRRESTLRHAGERGRYELSWVVAGGSNCRTLVSAMPLMDEEGRVIGSCGVVTDVTTRTRAQRETARAEKLRALGEMAGGVAHDFNNVLTAILGNAQYLLMGQLSEDARQAVTVIEKAALDGTETVRRIREFTRPRSGRLEGDAVDANTIVDDVVALVRKRVDDVQREQAIAITVTARKNARREIAGNASELREVLLNLVLNAIDAMPTGGKLTVESFDRGEDSIGLRVSDTGTGIDPEIRDKIFDPFFSTKQGGPSSGLGLSICYGIVRSHDGRIDVRTSSEGTTFTIVLPSFVPRSASTADSPTTGALPPTPKVLHVSPLGAPADRLRRALAERGAEVEGVETFGEAARLLATSGATAPNVLVTELALGRDSGWQLCRLARRSRPSIRIVLLADPGHGIDATQARNAGIDRILTRPFDIDDVHGTLLSALGAATITHLDDGTTRDDAHDTSAATVGIYGDDDSVTIGAAVPVPSAANVLASVERRARPARRRPRDEQVYMDEHTVAALDFILKRSGRDTDRSEGTRQ